MKRPRPVNSAESSTRGIDCPTHGELESLLANASLLAKAWLAASAIPKNPPAHVGCIRRNYLGVSPLAAISTNLKTYHPVSFSAVCSATSTRETGDIPELARADAGMIAKEPREVGRLGKAEALADITDAGGLVQHRVDRLFHAHDVQIDLWRHADRGFEQPEEVRPRQARFLCQGLKRNALSGFGPHRGHNFADAPVARCDVHFPDRSRKTPPRREALDHRDHQVG